MNALMYDYQNEEIIDLCGGLDDIKKHQVRCVDPQSFVEDPLRVLRIAQFIARFEMTVEEKTFDLGFEFLKRIKALPFYLSDLITTHQRLDYHPEGDVFTHTMLVIDVAALTKHKTDAPLSFMWSCLLHDIGKPLVTTADGHAPQHNEAGVKVFQKVKMIQSKKQRQYISTMIMYHMHLMNMARNHGKDLSYLRLLKKIDGKVSMNDLICISCCDKLGRGKVAQEQYDAFFTFIEDKIARLGTQAPQPLINGYILIQNGFQQNKQLKMILDEAYDLQLQGLSQEKILRSLKKKYE